ncbi:MAG: M28 family peptidase [Bacteroidales bacterium]|nr:M28 family peptidase [Bacteroidales bacterium]
MNLKPLIQSVIITAVVTIFIACGSPGESNNRSNERQPRTEVTQPRVQAPAFNADSAYYFTEKQVSFGPRVPNTTPHVECGNWLQASLERFADTVYVQPARLRAWDGTVLNIRNFIGSFQPENNRRILLCAHWDTRPWADHDPDSRNHFSPIDGANDGASGVGVLLEIARLLSEKQPNVGIDIIFFDAEDYGEHEDKRSSDRDTWALGSQHWSRTPHRPDYNARFGILLDMVGAYNATFRHEGYSLMYAPQIVRKVWALAQREGFGHLFLNEEGGYIVDDHYYINTIRGIPTINIIDQRRDTPHGFFQYWHTKNDTMDNIDRATLHAAGSTVLAVIFEE